MKSRQRKEGIQVGENDSSRGRGCPLPRVFGKACALLLALHPSWGCDDPGSASASGPDGFADVAQGDAMPDGETSGDGHGLPDGTELGGTLVFMQGLNIYRLDLGTGVQTQIATGHEPYQNRAGQLVWRDGSAIMADLGRGHEELAACWLCRYPTLSPDGAWVVWNDQLSGTRGFGTIVADVATGEVVYEIQGYDSGRSAWSEDGYLVLAGASNDGPEGIVVVDVDTGDMALVTSAIDSPASPTVSPDGQWIAAHSAVDDQVWLAPVGGTSATPLTRSVIGSTLPFFSSDGRFLMLTHGTQAGPKLRVIEAHPSEPVDLDAGQGLAVVVGGSVLWVDGAFSWR